MVTQTDIQTLAAIDAGSNRVLSVQLDLSPVRQIQRADIVAFDDLARRAEVGLGGAAVDALRREARRVHQFLESEPATGIGLLIFSCEPIGLWRVYRLSSSVPDDVTFAQHPRLRIAVDLVDEGERIAIAVVDSQQARLFVLNQLQVEDFWSLKSLVPGRHQQGGWSQANFQRSHDQAVDVHLRLVCRELEEFDRREPFTRLIVAGPDEPLNRLLHLMSDDIRRRVAGNVSGEMFQSDIDIIRASLDVARAARRRDEQRSVDELLDRAGGDGFAASGLDAVLRELHSGAVKRLVVAGDTQASGGVCRVCGRFAASVEDRCPVCGAALRPVDDVVEAAIRKTIIAGGEVEIVHGPAADELVARCGGVAAQLRFKVPTLTEMPAAW
jgi:hypothetical protein